MKHSVRGAFLSGAVFPGLGQVVLKHYVRGLALMLAVSANLFVFVKKAVEQALAILEKVQWEGGEIDVTAISKAATRGSAGSNSHTLDFLLLVIVSCWAFAIVDAYRLGRKKDLEDQSTTRGVA